MAGVAGFEPTNGGIKTLHCHNRLLVAQEAGHSVSTMERAYAAWITGAKPEDIERIKAAMASRPLTENAGEDRTISKHSNIPRQVATV
jgi:hypothetical protein